MHLLVIEDDPRLSRLLRRLLEEDRHVVELATDGESGLEIATATDGIEAIVLDIGLPGHLRPRGRASRSGRPGPTSRSSCSPRATPSATGSPASTPAPTTTSSSRSPTRSCPRASGRSGDAATASRRPEPKLVVGPITLDETSRRVTLDGKRIDLSPREFSLLECFLRHPGQTLSRDQLLDQAWPFSVAVTPNAVDAYIHYLREKLGGAGRLIETVRGVGYRLADA